MAMFNSYVKSLEGTFVVVFHDFVHHFPHIFHHGFSHALWGMFDDFFPAEWNQPSR
jgi:hypothetical protein